MKRLLGVVGLALLCGIGTVEAALVSEDVDLTCVNRLQSFVQNFRPCDAGLFFTQGFFSSPDIPATFGRFTFTNSAAGLTATSPWGKDVDPEFTKKLSGQFPGVHVAYQTPFRAWDWHQSGQDWRDLLSNVDRVTFEYSAPGPVDRDDFLLFGQGFKTWSDSDPSTTSTPEPMTSALFGLGVAGLWWRKKKVQA